MLHYYYYYFLLSTKASKKQAKASKIQDNAEGYMFLWKGDKNQQKSKKSKTSTRQARKKK